MFFLKRPRMKNPRNEQSIETILNCPLGMDTSLRRNDFWDRVVAQARLVIGYYNIARKFV